MGAMASRITSLMIVYSIVCSDADQRKHQSSTSLAFVRGNHRWPVNSPHKEPVTRKCFHLITSSWKLLISVLPMYFLSHDNITHGSMSLLIVNLTTFSVIRMNEYGKFNSRKCILKCRPQNGGHFVSTSMCRFVIRSCIFVVIAT